MGFNFIVYISCSEDEALDKICKMQEIINELALYFN